MMDGFLIISITLGLVAVGFLVVAAHKEKKHGK